MATPSCPRCSCHSFEIVTASVRGSRFPCNFVQCISCGCVIGVMEQYSAGDLVIKLAKKLGFTLD